MNKVDRSVLFSQCEFFVDYRASESGCDRSLRLGNQLQKKYGAKIVEQPQITSTTHIIFRNGSIQSKLFAYKYRIPIVDVSWLNECIEKRRLVKVDKYQVPQNENQNPTEELDFNLLAISRNDSPAPCTPKMKKEQIQDGNINSEKKTRRALYTPVRGQFDEGNLEEYFDHQNRVITLDNLGLNLPDDNHLVINRYGCSVARRQVLENPPPPRLELQELPTTSSIPSQSQSSPVIHFTNAIRPTRRSPIANVPSLCTTIDLDSARQYAALGLLPQSTPRKSPEPVEILIQRNLPEEPITPLKTADYTSFTKVTPFNNTKAKVKFEPLSSQNDDDDEVHRSKDNQQIIPRPPPLLALSQAFQAKHPEQLKVTQSLSSIKDLPNAPANYSFVFYQFPAVQLEEAKRLTRRMGDCFSYETIDMTTTHIILLDDDDSHTCLTLDLLLALIYGCRLVTFEWLKASSRIGEWLNASKFEPKRLYQSNPSLNIYRKSRQQQKAVHIFNECGLIYLTSIAKQRSSLLKLITLLGGNITINRNLAQIVIGHSSKVLPVVIYPQVTEEWVIESTKSGQCLPVDDYLIEDNIRTTSDNPNE